MANQEHDRALQRLEAALVEQSRLGESFDAAVGTATELGSYGRLRAATDRVTAREAWVHWVDDDGYRGLNAGPIELLAESRENSFQNRAGRYEDRDEERATRARQHRHAPGRGLGEVNRADDERRVEQTIKSGRELVGHRFGGRAWLHGGAVGGGDPRYMYRGDSHD